MGGGGAPQRSKAGSVRGATANRFVNDETTLAKLENRITHLEQVQSFQTANASSVQLHLEELEDRSRHKNLQFMGVPEGIGREALQPMVLAICQQLAITVSPQELEFKRLHRSLGPRSVNLNRPRDVICCFHRYAHKESISHKAWETGEIIYEGCSVKILPDLS